MLKNKLNKLKYIFEELINSEYNTEKSEGYLQSCMLPLMAIRFPTFGSKASFFCIVIYLTISDARWYASDLLSWFTTQY